MPLIIIVGCVVIKVNLIPYSAFNLFGEELLMQGVPYTVPVNMRAKPVKVPFGRRKVVATFQEDQLAVDEFLCNGQERMIRPVAPSPNRARQWATIPDMSNRAYLPTYDS